MPGGGDAGAPLLAMPGTRQRRAMALDDAALVANLMGRLAAGAKFSVKYVANTKAATHKAANPSFCL